jgi:hypothetical protein
MIDENEIEVAKESVPPQSGLELEIESLLEETQRTVQALRAAKAAGAQPFEVASTFLCNARSFARAGKDELARRRLEAARRVLAGGGTDE